MDGKYLNIFLVLYRIYINMKNLGGSKMRKFEKKNHAKASVQQSEQECRAGGRSNQMLLSFVEEPEEARETSQVSGGTPLSEAMRSRMEQKFGIQMDDVRVHYQSTQPSRFGASAYTYGSEIFLEPGQEKFLNHELGHVIQQKLGLVRPTGQEHGMPINNSPELEAGADAGTLPPGAMGISSSKLQPVVQYKKERFFPDHREPHLHFVENNIIFTDTRHHHTYLKRGGTIYKNNIKNVVEDIDEIISDRGSVDIGRLQNIRAKIIEEFQGDVEEL